MNALVGRTVYGNGSYAPTRGQVSSQGASGYLQRELRNKLKQQVPSSSPGGVMNSAMGNRNLFGGVSQVGSDGQSDTRSGVARSMLASMYTPSIPSTGVAATSGKAGNNGGSGYKPGGRGGHTPPTRPTPEPPTPTVPSSGTPTPPNPNGGTPVPSVPAPPQVQVNPDGTLNLPYDPQFGWDAVNATSTMNEQLLQLQLEQQQQQMDYQRNQRDFGQAYEDQKRGTLNSAAANGSAFSSAYGTAVADNARSYGNQMNDLNSYNNMFLNNANMRRMGIQNHFNAMMQQAAMALADKLAQQAGTLGLPGSTPETPPTPGGGTGNGGGGNKKPGGGKKTPGPRDPGGGGHTGGHKTDGGGSGGRPTTPKPKGKH